MALSEGSREHKWIDALFAKFLNSLEKANLVGKEGRIAGARVVKVAHQRNGCSENEIIIDGSVPDELEGNPNKLS